MLVRLCRAPGSAVDVSNTRIGSDYDNNVLCGRCVAGPGVPLGRGVVADLAGDAYRVTAPKTLVAQLDASSCRPG